MDDSFLEANRIYFPPYLTPSDKHQLFEELKQFPKPFQYFWASDINSVLQGDGLGGFAYIYSRPSGLGQKPVRGMVISNSCDIANAPAEDDERNVLFAPIAALERYLERCRALGKTTEQVESIADTIRQQKISHLFYLPAYGEVLSESIVSLDDIRPEPLSSFRSHQENRLFSLSQTGFYMLLIKLSIHFTRMQEAVRRFPEPA